MDTSKSVLESIEIESADFASQVYDAMEDGNDFCRSTMVVVIDELLHDLLSNANTADQIKMLSIVHSASKALKGVMLEEG